MAFPDGWSGVPEPEGWQTAALLNGWSNVAGGWPAAGWIMEDGWVTVRGLVTGGTVGSAIFFLPDGFRPAATEGFVVDSNGHCRVDVSVDGGIRQASGGSSLGCTLSGIRFRLSA